MEVLMKRLTLLILLVMLTLAAGAQALDQSQDEIPITRSDITAGMNPTPWPTPYPDSSLPPPDDCPVTRRPEERFIPPEPWPERPPQDVYFWYGDNGLWTALPASGSWRQLALGEKFWWWSEEFVLSEDYTPDLRVTARRLDGRAPEFNVTEATNGYHPSFELAMLIGVQLASPGCWEFTGAYKGHQLTFVLWVPPW
jgi:hypothetical protein